MLNEAVIRVLCACFSARIKQKRSLAFASDLGALEGTRTPDLLIRSQNFLVIFNENAFNCYSIVAL